MSRRSISNVSLNSSFDSVKSIKFERTGGKKLLIKQKEWSACTINAIHNISKYNHHNSLINFPDFSHSSNIFLNSYLDFLVALSTTSTTSLPIAVDPQIYISSSQSVRNCDSADSWDSSKYWTYVFFQVWVNKKVTSLKNATCNLFIICDFYHPNN